MANLSKISIQELSAKMWAIFNASDDWDMSEYMACWKGLMDYFGFKFKEEEEVLEVLESLQFGSYYYDIAISRGVENCFEEWVNAVFIDTLEKFTACVERFIEPIKTKSNA